MIKNFVCYLFVFLFCIYNNLEAQASTVVLSTCSQSDVNSAITSASNGDIIVCPAGSWSWSDVNITKNITLQGAGIGNTNITITASAGVESPSSYNGAFRITGFTFISNANFGDYYSAMLFVNNGHGWRVDHNEFQIYSNSSSGTGGNGMHILHDAAGLIDHNRFVKGGGSGCIHASIQISNSGTTSTSDDAQEYSWLNFDSNTVLGSADHAVFVEDNYFYNPNNCSDHNAHTMYSRHGGVVVFRHNEIHGFNADVHPFGDQHAGYAFEISNNNWIEDTGYSVWTMIDIAGGTGVIYNNTRTGSGASYGVQLLFKRSSGSGSNGSVTSSVPNYGTVAANTSCGSTERYPCAEQPGRGRNNSLDPIYIWGNTNLPSLLNSAGTTYIQAGRDYFLNQGVKPGYIAYIYPHPLSGGQPPPIHIPNPPHIIQIQ